MPTDSLAWKSYSSESTDPKKVGTVQRIQEPQPLKIIPFMGIPGMRVGYGDAPRRSCEQVGCSSLANSSGFEKPNGRPSARCSGIRGVPKELQKSITNRPDGTSKPKLRYLPEFFPARSATSFPWVKLHRTRTTDRAPRTLAGEQTETDGARRWVGTIPTSIDKTGRPRHRKPRP